ncbi:MAG: N-acetylmuramidase domain-containing protein [candidate division KSB1 bacterium]|nr:N-acetylmuramidase domain-containing protein [candidate division KSB1 bacterium]MDZ7335113.1 N-acetylmuramidase domain-containing protein [candidate division KSB1 bacterium]MDZ7356608.1 N-acetylmuramidase domain-containing protein [candidate division KSB1 bacterium]MDZ7398962.1 N-acetylmuramidase domain-containing protein [candidate division KSB1 bacterium]
MAVQKAIVNVEKLNIRAGPGMEFPIVGQLAKGLVVHVRRIQGDWAELDLSLLEGYVARANIAFHDSSSVATQIEQVGVIDADKVNIRSGPGTSFEPVAMLNKGDMVVIEVSGSDWHQVRTRPINGFVMSQLLVPATPAEAITEGPYRAAIKEIVVNLRSGPGEQFAIIGQLAKDTEIIVKRSTNGWAEIETIPIAGYLRADLIRVGALEYAALRTPTSNPLVTVKADWLRLRKGPGEPFATLAYLPAGNLLELMDLANDWVRVRPIMGQAFVAQTYLAPVAAEILSIPTGHGDPLKPPNHLIIPIQDAFSTEQQIMAANWNDYGGLIQQISSKFSIDPVVVLAVLSVESRGKGFGLDGRLLIRFENHYFYQFWGKANEELFHRHFRFHSVHPWQGHQYRRSQSAKWLDVHTDDQRSEWDAFEFAKQLDRLAAFQSISMGSPQIMGANFDRIGYDSPEEMFFAFQSDSREQLWAMFRYIESKNLIPELISENFIRFAEAYNGPAQASAYGEKLRQHVDQFRKIAPKLV